MQKMSSFSGLGWFVIFYGSLITLEQVVTSVVEKKKNLNEQNDFHLMLS